MPSCNSSAGEDRERKQPRTLASSTLDLVPLNQITTDRSGLSGGQPGGVLSGASARMETVIDNADSCLRSGNRFSPLSS